LLVGLCVFLQEGGLVLEAVGSKDKSQWKWCWLK
jgi:hypothetical protein